MCSWWRIWRENKSESVFISILAQVLSSKWNWVASFSAQTNILSRNESESVSIFSPDQQLVENMEEEQNEHPSSGVELNAVSLNNLEQVLQNEEWVEDATWVVYSN